MVRVVPLRGWLVRSQLRVASGNDIGIVEASEGKYTPACQLGARGKGYDIVVGAFGSEHGKVGAVYAPASFAMLQKSEMKMTAGFSRAGQGSDAELDGFRQVTAGYGDQDEVGACFRLADVESLVAKIIDEGFGCKNAIFLRNIYSLANGRGQPDVAWAHAMRFAIEVPHVFASRRRVGRVQGWCCAMAWCQANQGCQQRSGDHGINLT